MSRAKGLGKAAAAAGVGAAGAAVVSKVSSNTSGGSSSAGSSSGAATNTAPSGEPNGFLELLGSVLGFLGDVAMTNPLLIILLGMAFAAVSYAVFAE